MSRHKSVFFLSRQWPADHPVLLRWEDYYRSRGVRFFHLHIAWNLYYPDRKRKLKQFLWLLAAMLRKRTFLIHANDLESALLAVTCKKFLGVPFIYDAHEVYSHEYPVEIEDQFYKNHKSKAEQNVLPAANVVLVPNQQRIDFFRQLYPQLQGVNYALVENKSWWGTDRPVHNQYTSLLPAGIKLFYGGTFWMGRKQESFPQLAAALQKQGMHLVLSGYRNEYLNQLISDGAALYVGNIPVEEYVDFVRHIDIALAWYYPTTMNDELCAPLKIFDYLAAQKPVIASRLPYLEELSQRFKGAIHLFEPGNWEDCLRTAEQVAANYNHYCTVVKNIPPEEISWQGQYQHIEEQLKKAGVQLCAA